MSKTVRVTTGKKHTVVKRDLLKVRVISHFSRPASLPEATGQAVTGTPDKDEKKRWGTGKPVVGATVSIQGTKATAVTDAKGFVTLDLASVKDGDHELRITPDAKQTTATHLAKGFQPDAFNAGPSLVWLDVPKGPDFTYRPVRFA